MVTLLFLMNALGLLNKGFCRTNRTLVILLLSASYSDEELHSAYSVQEITDVVAKLC